MSGSELISSGKENKQYATFKVGKLLFGIDVHHVQEIIKSQRLTQVPLAEHIIRGLINLRGQIITAIDLRRRLSVPEVSNDEDVMNIVVQFDDERVSLLVDSVGDVLELSPSQFEAVPPTISGKLRDVVEGVYKLQDSLMLVLNTKNAVEV